MLFEVIDLPRFLIRMPTYCLLFLAPVVDLSLEDNCERRTNADLRLNLDVTFHAPYNLLANAETKAMTSFVFN